MNATVETWKQERPAWCPHPDCGFRAVVAEHGACMGELPEPTPHGAGENSHRLCIRGAKDDGEWTFDLQVCRSDIWWFRRLFDMVFPVSSGRRVSEPRRVREPE